jgi:hypothetical protein
VSTASKTPNLGLMSPVGSDQFDIADFDTSFMILDQNPGTIVVANQASRPTGWGVNQHGRRVLQADQGIEWWWNMPSSLPAGVWTRVGPKGWLGGTFHGGSVASASTSGVTIASLSLLCPGGRPILVMYSFLWATQTNLSNQQIAVEYFENGNFITSRFHDGTGYGANNSNPPDSGMMYFLRNPAPTAQANVTFSLAVLNQPGHPVGTAAIWDTTLDVFEI